MLILFLLLTLTSCAHLPKVHTYRLNSVGGLSGLLLEKQSKDEFIFWTLTDRGPNAQEVKRPDSDVTYRPFVEPEFRPKLIRFSVNRLSKEVRIMKTIHLEQSGLPNNDADEMPMNLKGEILNRDPEGIDPESICFDGKNIWIGEEYGPSLLKYSLEGKLLRRFVPKEGRGNSHLSPLTVAALPKKIRTRKPNRGFEGIACVDKKIFAILQSPLPADGNNVLMIQFDPETQKVEKEFYYPLDSKEADKIGDLNFHEGKFYVIEQNGQVGPEGFHRVYSFQLDQEKAPVVQNKTLALDLVKVSYDFADKVEGLAILDGGGFAVINDNDFGLTGPWDEKAGTVMKDESRQSILGILCHEEDC